MMFHKPTFNPISFWLLPLLLVALFTASSQVSRAEETTQPKTAVVEACHFQEAGHQIYLPMLSSGTSNVITPEPMVRALQYEVGKTYIYDYRAYSSSLFNSMDSEGIHLGDPNRILLEGTAEVSITGIENDDTFVGSVRLNNLLICGQNGDSPEKVDDPEILTEMQTPVLFKQKADGTLLEVQIAAEIDPVAANYAKGVLNALQNILQDEDSYVVEESGTQGEATVAYTAVLRHDGLAIRKAVDDGDFSEFHSDGDEPGVLIDTSIQVLLDRQTGVFSQINIKERNELLPLSEEMDQDDLNGMAFWGYAHAEASLQLTAVVNTTPDQLPRRALTYRTDQIGVAFSPMDHSRPTGGLQLEQLDLQAEFDALEADPTSPALFTRLRWVVNTDYGNTTSTVLNALVSRLNANLHNEDVALTYLSLLHYDGSPTAQAALRDIVDPAADHIPANVKQYALYNLALVESPEPASYNLLQQVMVHDLATDEQKTSAVLGLGAMANSLHLSDPTAAQDLTDILQANLAVANTDEEIEIALLALGNTNLPNLFSIMEPYFHHPNGQIQGTAIWGIRNDPSPEAEDKLLEMLDPVFSVDPEPWLDDPFNIPKAVDVLKNRPGHPSEDVNQTLAAFDELPPQPKGGVFMEEWELTFGGDNIGGKLPGRFVWKSPPHSERLMAFANQKLDYYLIINRRNLKIDRTGNIIYGEVTLSPKNNDPLIQHLKGKLDIFGQTVTTLDREFTCGNSHNAPIHSGSVTLVKTSFNYSIWVGIVIGIQLDASAHYKLSYEYNWDVCDVVQMSADVALIGEASASASAKGTIQVFAWKGGVLLEADIINMEARVALSATYSLVDDFEACITIPVTVKALDLTLSFVVEKWEFDWKKFKGSWVYKLYEPFWNWTLVTKTFNPLNHCWVPDL